jgi:hypothetical protein
MGAVLRESFAESGTTPPSAVYRRRRQKNHTTLVDVAASRWVRAAGADGALRIVLLPPHNLGP